MSANQSLWSPQLSWVEYAHNSITSAATGQFLFKVFLGYLPPLLPAVEGDHTVPSVQHHHHWSSAPEDQRKKQTPGRSSQGPSYQPGQKVRLSNKNIPLGTDSKTLAPCFFGSYEVLALIKFFWIVKTLTPVFKNTFKSFCIWQLCSKICKLV